MDIDCFPDDINELCNQYLTNDERHYLQLSTWGKISRFAAIAYEWTNWMTAFPNEFIANDWITAVAYRKFKVLDWFQQNKPPVVSQSELAGIWEILAVPFTNSTDGLEWLWQHYPIRCAFDKVQVLDCVTKRGRAEHLQWYIDHHFGIGEISCVNIIDGGDCRMVDVLIKNQVIRTDNTHWCTRAAGAGHLDALTLLRKNGFSWDYYTLRAAENYGHFEVLEWALQKGCPSVEPPEPPIEQPVIILDS